MSEWQFDQETAVTVEGDGRWGTRLSAAWNIGDNPNGGYAAISSVRAMGSLIDLPDPVSITTCYLRPGAGDRSAQIDAELVRSGRRSATATASMSQDGRERLRLMAMFADLEAEPAGAAEPPSLSIPSVELPPPEACRPRAELAQMQGVELPITSRVDVRVDPETAEPGQAGRAEVRGWIRFADGRAPDTFALPAFADAFPPAVFGLLGSVGWVPTLELTVHVRRRPVPGWIAARFRTEDLDNGMLVEDGELWDSAGHLVARSRQLALLLMDGSA
ncbi:MAG: thioesterase family protein [Halofilum sp. (in: g-proteobacteria)]